LDKLNGKNNSITHYLQGQNVYAICIDHSGSIWAGTGNGLYQYNTAKDRYSIFQINDLPGAIQNVEGIIEDKESNLWVSTNNHIVKIFPGRNTLNIYGKNYGITAHESHVFDNYVAKDGEIFLGGWGGYNAFYPNQIKAIEPPLLTITEFKVNEQEVFPVTGSILKIPVWQAKEIQLKYGENNFSFDFTAIDYEDPKGLKYAFRLDNYDNNWHYIEAEHKAYFFHIPPGNYVFRAKVINSGGVWKEKIIAIKILPPWWETWWFRVLSVIALIIVIYAIIQERSRKLKAENIVLEQKVAERTAQLKRSLEELKSTQAQLIQSEKMASLGELTAGIAHEIQNPLNFVNNFSEISNELIDEMKEELNKGDVDEAKFIADDIKQNLEKINHHGKRADAIVKGMLQHSRNSNGIKEPTDINTLADEWIRVAYNSIRAKDKLFNATLQTDFDNSIGNVNIIPPDIGRVLLNLYNNAFYAVMEKKKTFPSGYEPEISVITKKIFDKMEIRIKDNGVGISQKALDKIFQPFFTTKPTGEGTGLGLSLAYDIITKNHNGAISVKSKEGEGTIFIIELPV